MYAAYSLLRCSLDEPPEQEALGPIEPPGHILILLLLGLKFAALGVERNGSWIGCCGMHIQPSDTRLPTLLYCCLYELPRHTL